MKYWIEIDLTLIKMRINSRVNGFTILNFCFYYHSQYPGQSAININKEIVGFDWTLGYGKAIAIFFVVPLVFREIKSRA